MTKPAENKPGLPDQLIRDCLHNQYGLDIVALTRLPLGADMNAAVYKAEARDGLRFFVKLKQGHQHDMGLAIIELLQQAGIQQIIAPLKTLQNQTAQRLENFTLLVYPFMAGEDGFQRALTAEQWVMLGKVMRQVHGVSVPPAIQQQLGREVYAAKWREIVRVLYSQLEVEISHDEFALKLASFMKTHQWKINRLVDTAEALAAKVQLDPSPYVLCHSDIHGGNVLLAANNSLYIVDWDEPIMAPKERDLMFIGGGVGNVWNKPHEVEWFYQGYGQTDINPALLAYYRHERIVEDIALYAQDLLLTQGPAEARAVMYKQFLSMFEPGGVVDIALTA